VRINNKRVSNLAWDEEATFETERALGDADADAIAEAYCYVGQDGRRFGLHHEVVDKQLILNREAVFTAMGAFTRGPAAQGEGKEPDPLTGIRRADKIKAMEHLQRHADALQQIG